MQNGGPSWQAQLGRWDSRTANRGGTGDIPLSVNSILINRHVVLRIDGHIFRRLHCRWNQTDDVIRSLEVVMCVTRDRHSSRRCFGLPFWTHLSLRVGVTCLWRLNAVIFWREPAAAANRETDCIKSGSGGFFSNRIERIEEREERKSLLLLFLVFNLDFLVFTIAVINSPIGAAQLLKCLVILVARLWQFNKIFFLTSILQL